MLSQKSVADISFCFTPLFALRVFEQTAIIWEADEPGEHIEMTYEELLQEVCKTANILKSFGVKKGDVSCSPGIR